MSIACCDQPLTCGSLSDISATQFAFWQLYNNDQCSGVLLREELSSKQLFISLGCKCQKTSITNEKRFKLLHLVDCDNFQVDVKKMFIL